ncbi:MAG TPA: sortase [Vitreimonas sp.]|nr:sortase [Vitreimonas sp.]
MSSVVRKYQLMTLPSFLRISQAYTRRALVGDGEPVEQLYPQTIENPKSHPPAGGPNSSSSVSAQPFVAKTKTKSSVWSTLKNGVLNTIIALSLIIASAVVVPALYYTVFPAEVVALPAEGGTPLGGNFDQAQTAPEVTAPAYEPPTDPTLPQGRWIVIPRIGVRTELRETENPDEALNKGVWMVPGYGQPGDKKQPMIVAAHRYGWDWMWQNEYWKYNTFYLLPELEPGDTVEIIADQKKWVYEIYAGEEGTEISDYDADMIMYTCKFLNSSVRHFRYARLIDPTKNTQ